MYVVFLFFFFKQKTAYEMRISDWSSDVCSSDLNAGLHADIAVARADGRTAAKLDVEVLVAQCRSQVDLSTVLHRRRTEGLEPFAGRIGKRCSNRSGGIEVVHPGAAQGGDPLRTEERRVGKEWVRPSRHGRSPDKQNKKPDQKIRTGT